MVQISSHEINVLARYILDISGIHLDQSKGYLFENRLKPLLASEGLTSYEQLHNRALSDSSGRLKKSIIDAISTNETFFFRDNTPFDLLKNKIIPDLIDRRTQQYGGSPIPIRIWSAACSTGQEVYSIAITLLEMLPDRRKYDISIFGTDISGKAIAQASYGKYNKFEVERGLPQNLRNKYFTRSGADWRIKDEVRSLAQFEKMNLLRPFPAALGPFDVVFCRNVAIYFQNHDKINLFKKIAKILSPGGSLLVGGSENLVGSAPDFISKQYLRGIFYQLHNDAQPEQVLPAQKTVVQPVSSAVKKAVSKARRKIVYDRPQKTKVKKAPPVSATRIPKEKESLRQEEAGSPVANEVPVDHTANTVKDQKQPPVPLVGKLVSRQNGEKKSPLLASLEAQDSGSSSSLLERGQDRSSSKQSLLEKISRQNKKEQRTNDEKNADG